LKYFKVVKDLIKIQTLFGVMKTIYVIHLLMEYFK